MVERHMFDGELMSAGEVSRRYPAYSPSVVLQAMREDGCQSLADLQQRDRDKAARLRRSQTEAVKHAPRFVPLSRRAMK